jgi:sulfofructose kinase
VTLSGRLPLVPADARAFDVVGFGENSVDLVAVVDEWPTPDTKHSLTSFDRLSGGQIATAIAACVRLGCRARYAGVFGDDEPGEWLRRQLAQKGIDVQATVVRGAATRSALILVARTTGARAVLERRDPRLNLDPAALDLQTLSAGRILLVDATDVAAATRAAAAARQAGVRTVLDVDRPVPGLAALLAEADIVITSETFPRAYFGVAAVEGGVEELARATGATLVAATCGANGSVASYEGKVIRTTATRVEVVDTTGAGDAFRAGFIAGWVHSGGEVAVEVLLAQANRAAGLSCRGAGAQGALPTWAEVETGV